MLDATVDHVAIAVHSIPAAMRLYGGVLGATFLFAGDQPTQGFRWAQFRFAGGGKVELVTPLGPGGFVARFLERRGEGVHHITLRVADFDRAVESLRADGVPLLGVSTEHPGWMEAFIHPRDAHGTLIQVARPGSSDEEMARHHLAPHDGADHRHLSLEDLLADQPAEPGGA